MDNNYHETSDCLYLLHSGLVLPFKKVHYPTIADALRALDKKVRDIFSDIEILPKVMEKQNKIQQKLYQIIMNNENDPNEVRNVIL